MEGRGGGKPVRERFLLLLGPALSCLCEEDICPLLDAGIPGLTYGTGLREAFHPVLNADPSI